ncbi:MAG: M14 family zinc carboxypeptidase [Cyanophyceae cyanobacterium]
MPTVRPSTLSAVKHLVFIDSSVDNYHQLLAGIYPYAEAFVLHPSEDGVQQITQALSTRQHLDSIHLVSHGCPGSLRLGNAELSLDTLVQYGPQLQQWRQALSKTANLLIYGCEVGATERGAAFLYCLKALVGAEVAASKQRTGSAALGGNWQLEESTGAVEAALAFTPETMAAYDSILSVIAESFDGSDFPPRGWERFPGENELGPNAGWTLGVDNGFGGRSVAFVPPEDVEGGVAQDWLVTPLLRPSAENSTLSFDARQVFPDDLGSNYAVQVSTAGQTDPDDFETVLEFTEAGIPFDEYQTYAVDFSDYVGEDIYVAFVLENDNGDFFAIDDVEGLPFTPDILISQSGDRVGLSRGGTNETIQVALTTQPSSDVLIDFSTDSREVASIESALFTPENWEQPQVVELDLAELGSTGEPETPFSLAVSTTTEDPDYATIDVDNITGTIVDSGIPFFPSYRTVEETFADLSALAEANPDIASWVDIGDSYDKVTSGSPEGYDIYALELTNPSTGSEDKPTFYVEGAIHAREYTTAELVTRFAEDLVAGYGTDADATWLLDEFKIAVVPIVNPDGRKFAEQGYLWRKNTNPEPNLAGETAPFPDYGVDLNRNFDSQWGEVPGGSSGEPGDATYRGTSAFSEPETQAVRDYVLSLFPDQKGSDELADAVPDDATGIFIDVHSFGQLILYPFGWTSEPAPDRKALETLGRKFGYFTGVDGEAYDVSQAIGLYPTDGTTDDWAYETLGVAGYTFELGTQFFEESDYFEEVIVPEATPALFYAAKAAYRPYQQPFGPDTVELSVDLEQVVAGTTVELSATADDTRYDDGATDELDSPPEPIQDIAAARYSIDVLPWEAEELTALTAADGAFDSAVEGLTGTLDTSALAPGRYTVFVQSEDANANFGVASAVFVEVVESPPDAETTTGSDDAETLTGLDGSEVIYARGGDDTVAGGQGDDLLFGNAGDDVLRGDRNDRSPGGPDGGDDTLYGGAGDDRLGGKGGDDELIGGAGNDDLWGDAGDDLLRGGLGDDTLTGDDFSGGEGSDVFVLAAGEGTDTIADFEVGIDLIGLAELSFADLTLGESDGSTSINLGDELLAVLDAVSDPLTEADFTPIV